MPKRKSELLSIDKALYLIMNGDLSDVDLEDSGDEVSEPFTDNISNIENDKISEPCSNNACNIEINNDKENTINDEKKNRFIPAGNSKFIEFETVDEEENESIYEVPCFDIVKDKSKKKKLNEKNSDSKKNKMPVTAPWKKKDHTKFDTDFKGQFPSPPHEIMTPLQYFKIFCDDNIIENFVNQTNLYSCQNTATSINTNKAEMEIFLGIHFMTALVRMPSYSHYWSDSTRFSLIADSMPRNRFQTLRQYFHVNDNSKNVPYGQADHDRLFKVRPLIDVLRENMKKIDKEENLSIDEFIIPFKGRSKIKQYVKNKPHKWGIKAFALCGTSGMLYDFEIYAGKDTITEKTTLGISGDVVIRLAETVPRNKNHKLFVDNWFSSYNLAVQIQACNLLMAATVRENRLPKNSTNGFLFSKDEKKLKDSGRGSYDFATDDKNITAVKWFDNKCVTVISTFCGVEPVENVKRWSAASKSFIEVKRPHIVDVYNKGMGGVDLMDMLVELYRVDIRAKRYYLRIIFHLLDICIVNAWLLYRRHLKQTSGAKAKFLPLYDFKSSISKALLVANKYQRSRGRPKTSDCSPSPTVVKKSKIANPISDVRFDNLGHWPLHMEEKRRCKLCIKSYTRTMCEKCNVALCLNKTNNCFKKFHVK